AGELVRANVDAILAFGDLAPRMVRERTRTIPIVAVSDDILATGLVDSLSRPGGNTTGLTIMSPELSAKRLAGLIAGRSGVGPDNGCVAGWGDGKGGAIVESRSAGHRSAEKRGFDRCFPQGASRRCRWSECAGFTIAFIPFSRNHRSRRRASVAGDLSVARTCGCGRAALVWAQSHGTVATGGDHRGQGSQGNQTGRSVDRATYKIRTGD